MIKHEHADADVGYLTTTGRRSGKPHTVEIWFAVIDDVIYLLSGARGRSDWCRNVEAAPPASFRIARTDYPVTGRRIRSPKERQVARDAVFTKYDTRYAGDLTEWRDASTPYALDPRA